MGDAGNQSKIRGKEEKGGKKEEMTKKGGKEEKRRKEELEMAERKKGLLREIKSLVLIQ